VLLLGAAPHPSLSPPPPTFSPSLGTPHHRRHRPEEEELASFGRPDATIYNAGAFPANRFTSYMTSSTSIDISFAKKEVVSSGLGGGVVVAGWFVIKGPAPLA
jgi:hypothetical protein